MRAENLPRVFRLSPVARRHAGPADPDFAHAIRSAGRIRLRIDDRDSHSGSDSAATGERAAARGFLFRRTNPVALQFRAVYIHNERRAAIRAARNDQRRFGESVGGPERIFSESAWAERFG